MTEAIIVAFITGAFSFLGVYFSNRKSAALLEFRIKALEQKVEAHNNLVERMYAAEDRLNITDEKIKVVGQRLDGLERSAS